MKTNPERLARIMLILLVTLAISVPVVTRLKSVQSEQGTTITLHARMPEAGGWTPDTIQISVGQPLHLRMVSDDVLHSFAIGKSAAAPIDLYPGEMVETTLVFDEPGKYIFYCTHWCGPNHWRMRGVIEVRGEGAPVISQGQPLYLQMGLDLDAPREAAVLPVQPPDAERGAELADLLPPYAFDKETYLQHSPIQLWQMLRAEPELNALDDQQIWDAVYYIWMSHASDQQLTSGQKIYDVNCSACHGETGKGDGVMAEDLPPTAMKGQESSPPDFSDPQVILSASPALLAGKIIRGGMGTGMPYWGPIFTDQDLDALIIYIYSFYMNPGAISPSQAPQIQPSNYRN
jgi:mono/diheme cytochrome c family protein/plastocyanin